MVTTKHSKFIIKATTGFDIYLSDSVGVSNFATLNSAKIANGKMFCWN